MICIRDSSIFVLDDNPKARAVMSYCSLYPFGDKEQGSMSCDLHIARSYEC